MAAQAAAALLDELMGRDRNLQPTEKRSELKWDDPEVCKYFLCGFCPHELFVNTRADLGNCEKIHDDVLKKEYTRSSRFEKMGYEEEFMRFLQTLISDVERRIRRGHQRLALNSTQGTPSSNAAALKEEKVAMLTERINELVQQAENLGCEGKVEEAQGVMKLCDQLREERKALESSRQINQTPESEKTMEVCNVCGALLVVGDIQQRIDEHIMGKQHSGYARIRTYVEERNQQICYIATERVNACSRNSDLVGIPQKTRERKLQSAEEREARLVREKEEREKEREREKEKEREEKRKKEKEREREKERENREKWGRSRCHNRRSRSRSRDRKRRSRSRTSRHRHRSGSKDKHKSGRRHRSRSHSSTRSHSSRQPNHRSRRSRSRELKARSDSKESKYRSRSPDSKTSSPGQEFNKYRSRSRDSKRRSGSKESTHRSQSEDRKRRSVSLDSKQLSGNCSERKYLHLENDKRGLYNDCDLEQMEEMQYEKYEDGEIPSDSRGDVDSNEETGARSEGDTK